MLFLTYCCVILILVFQEEVKNLQQLNHRGIISAIFVKTCDVNLCVLLPLMVHRSCDQIIANQFTSGFPESAIGIILKDILSAVDYLHNRKIVHWWALYISYSIGLVLELLYWIFCHNKLQGSCLVYETFFDRLHKYKNA